MSETKKKIETYLVNYTCDLCNIGTMVPTGVSLMSNPPKYIHACNKCKAEARFMHTYPRHTYEAINESRTLQELQNKVDRLQKKINDASWVTNPDRMGGAFTQQEIADSQAWR